MIDLNALSAPFPASRISWRLGATNSEKTSGIALAYIDARDVIERLDHVCGPERWQNKHPHANGKTSCAIGIKIGEEWVWKENGAGDSQVEAEKGAFSDSFKRAAVMWGIGRYLYDMPNIWIEIEAAGKSHKIKKSEYAKLEAALNSIPVVSTVKETPEQRAKVWFANFQKNLHQAKSTEDAKKIATTNAKALEAIKKDAPKIYEEIMAEILRVENSFLTGALQVKLDRAESLMGG